MTSKKADYLFAEVSRRGNGRVEGAQHTVARCCWNTRFDDEYLGNRLQQTLSDFSRELMPRLLEQSFDRFCTENHTWRMDRLTLDLGRIPYSELVEVLPNLFMDKLLQALYQRWDELPQEATKFISSPVSPKPLPKDSEWLNRKQARYRYIEHFLRFGSSPWWDTQFRLDKRGQDAILLQQLQQNQYAMAALLKRIGQMERVRQRLVWQYRQETIKALVKVLSPYHHPVIINFADELLRQQRHHPLVSADQEEFSKARWLWILTHLIVERGSLFNTKMFVHSTLKQFAAHYHVEYELLLEQLNTEARRHFSTVSNPPAFIRALMDLASQYLTPLASSTPERESDPWDQMAQILECNTSDEINPSALLFDLAALDSHRLAKLLRQQQKQKSPNDTRVSERLINLLDRRALSKLVEVLAPNDHRFIHTHLSLNEQVLCERQCQPNLVWKVVLSYLLNDAGSFAGRRQFVRHTLEKLSKSRSISYIWLLESLIRVLGETDGGHENIELFKILIELKKLLRTSPSNKIDNHSEDAYLDTLGIYLETGYVQDNHPSLKIVDIEAVYLVLCRNRPNALSDLLLKFARRDPFGHWADRILRLSARSNIDILFSIVSPLQGAHATQLMERFIAWQKRAARRRDFKGTVLLSLDMERHIRHSLLLTLLRSKKTASSARDFFSDWMGYLASNYRVPIQEMTKEIYEVLQGENLENNPVIGAILSDLGHKRETSRGKRAKHLKAFDKWSSSEKIALFIDWIIEGETILRLEGIGIDRLMESISELPMTVVLKTLRRHFIDTTLKSKLIEKSNHVSMKIFLDRLWPYHTSTLSGLIDDWTNEIVKSGIWRGSSAVLRAEMQQNLHLFLLEFDGLPLGKSFGPSDQVIFWRRLVLTLSCVLNMDPQSLLQTMQSVLPKNIGTAISVSKIFEETNSHASQYSCDAIVDMSSDSHTTIINDETNVSPLVTEMLLEHWLLHGSVPMWIRRDWDTSIAIERLRHLFEYHPKTLARIIQRLYRSVAQRDTFIDRLRIFFDFENMLALMTTYTAAMSPHQQPLLTFHQTLMKLDFSKIGQRLSSRYVLDWLWQYVFLAWLEGRHDKLRIPSILNSLLFVCFRQTKDAERWCRFWKESRCLFPIHTQTHIDRMIQTLLSSESVERSNKDPPRVDKLPITSMDKNISSDKNKMENTMPIPINNAGLVLFQSFLIPYFSRLDLVRENRFVDTQSQQRAVHFLQFLATGRQTTDEQYLVLNKILVGLLPVDPVINGIEMKPEKIQIGESLIDAMIQHWTAIGSSSIDGFRGNWLIRNGLLTEQQEYWQLQVEKRPYDILLERLPVGYSQIKLPWMKHRLSVEWVV